MKKLNKIIVCLFASSLLLSTSCVKDLLDQEVTNELGSAAFWKTEEDATNALMGLYAQTKPLFNKDYYYDGHSGMVRVRGVSTSGTTFTAGAAYNSGNYNPSGYGSSFDEMYRYLFGGVNRANYVIDNVTEMLPRYPQSKEKLEAIIGEAKLLRSLIYFRLITMWGDVPYIPNIIYNNSEVQTIARTPIAEIKNHLIEDLTYAFEKMPVNPAQQGRMAKPAALALRGKVNLYWASWNKFGWPELTTFTPSATEAVNSYKAAEADFKSVIDDFGLTLFRNGDPGSIDALGKSDILPNYYHLFLPAANGDKEFLIAFTHGGPGTGLSEKLTQDFGTRNSENSQCFVTPMYWLADYYQSTTTGDYAPALNPVAPAAGGRTIVNGALNPQSYANRDYRMKSSMLWDYETLDGFRALVPTGKHPFIHRLWNSDVTIGGITYKTVNTDGTNSGYIFRKYIRNTAGLLRDEGNFNWPVMRLADVYLMYAEASLHANGGAPLPYAVEMVNRVRRRGNLPALSATITGNGEAFFNAIKQERLVELVAEGHLSFDMRRWRDVEEFWGGIGGPGRHPRNTHGDFINPRYFQNATERNFQQCYIFRIPPGERDRNPNLTQNMPYL